MDMETRSVLLRELRDAPAGEIASWLRRGELQLEFARAFRDALPSASTEGWQDAIDRAHSLLNGARPEAGIEGLKQAVLQAEDALQIIGAVAKTYTIHCVGHGHIDMNWMWSWPETVSTTHDTFASVLSLMEQYPELTYSQSQTSVYALMERHFPEMFAQIQQRVREGRWEVTAPHWVEGEKNLASGESICRHLLYSRNYFQEKFDLSPEDVPVDWEPDTFGHANTIPMILTQGGLKYYYSCRTGGGFDHAVIGPDPRPRLFRWQAPDGSQILVNRESTWYNSDVNIGPNIALPLADFVKETGLRDWLNIYGVGNHGGGPTRTEINYYLSLREWPIYPNVVFGTSKRYFETIAAQLAEEGARPLPVLDHELNFEFTGCYTSQSLIKQANRFGENYLEEAETLALLAHRVSSLAYPTARLREAWLNVLFNQFHDILPGSGVRETREHAMALFQETGAITGAIKRAAGKALTARIDTVSLLPDTPSGRQERETVQTGTANTPFVAGAGIGAMQTGYSQASGGGRRFRPFVVYNPCAWTRSERVTVALYDTDFAPGRIVALDPQGVAHPTLFLGRGSDWAHDKLTVAFDAHDVPPLGYKTYLLCEGVAQPLQSGVQVQPGNWFETPFLRFRVDRNGGGIKDLIDKRTGANLVQHGLFGGWNYVQERPRGMTAWALGEEVDAPEPLRGTGFGITGIARNEGNANPLGGESLGCRVDWHLQVPNTHSSVRLSLMVHALAPRLDFTADVDWREIGDNQRGIPGLSVAFPLWADKVTEARYETPFGSVTRDPELHEEVPTLRYAHLEGSSPAASHETSAPFGMTLVQDCKYGHTLDGSELRMRIVRSSFDPDHAPEVAKHQVRYSVTLHDKPADPADLSRLGAAWNHPFLVLPANLQSGDAPAQAGFAQVQTPNVVLSALKQAEDGNGLIVRLVEQNGQDGEAVLELHPSLTTGITRATLADLMERPVDTEATNATWQNNTLRVPIRARSFVTVRLHA